MVSSDFITDLERQRPQKGDTQKNPTTQQTFANPGPLGSGGFAVTLMALSLSMLGCRDVSNQTLFIGNLCFIAGLGLLISAQWEMVRGNKFGYTVLTSFGFYYGGYGVLLTPSLGVVDAYGGYTAEYYNAFGLYLLVWSILNSFFLLASLAINVPNIIIFSALEFSYIFNCASQFAMADGNLSASAGLTRVAGAFGLVSAASGFYLLGSELCQGIFPFRFPLGDTSRLFRRQNLSEQQIRTTEQAMTLRVLGSEDLLVTGDAAGDSVKYPR